MSTADDLMALADDYASAVADSPRTPTPLERKLAVVRIEAVRYALVAAIESALQAEYKRGRGEHEQAAEPVAWWVPTFENPFVGRGRSKPFLWPESKPLYASPPKREPLTHEQIVKIMREADSPLSLILKTERAHGIGDE